MARSGIMYSYLSNSYSPGILSPKVGQPATNCKGFFFDSFWSKNMSSITYQKFQIIRVEEVVEKRVFSEPYTALHRNEADVLPRAAWASEDWENLLCFFPK